MPHNYTNKTNCSIYRTIKAFGINRLFNEENYYLINATNGNEVSKYHLEAGIAYWHTTSTENEKWQHILQLYN